MKISGTTSTGFEYEINDNVANDMEFLDALTDLESDNHSESVKAYSVIIKKMFPGDKKKALYNHVRAADGRVPIENVSSEIGEILKNNGDLKK